jgi:DNA repair protein RecO (recombination protein O)
MERWEDQGIVLAVRPHGENGAIVSLLTEGRGRHAGYVRGAQGTRMRGSLEAGNLVDAGWQARVDGDLGSLSLELVRSPAAHIMQDALKLAALQSACALCDSALPEREGHPGLFHGLNALFEALQGEVWGAAYVMWEIAFLRELGFSLDFSKCAGGGDVKDLAYVSPKTGRAVSEAAGFIYKERLLKLPGFLRPVPQGVDDPDVLTGLEMTAYFLEHWAYAHHSQGIPDARLRFQARFAKTVGDSLQGPLTEHVA